MTYASEYYGAGGVVTGAATAISGHSIPASVGEIKIVDITCNQDVSGSALSFIVETKAKLDVATVADEAITKIGTTARLTLTEPMTETDRTLNWSLVIAATNETVASGLLFCTYDAQGD